MGVRKTADFLEKATWSLAIALLALSLISILVIPRNTTAISGQDTELMNKIENIAPIPSDQLPPAQD
jgi:preprotein translocase subunit SecG